MVSGYVGLDAGMECCGSLFQRVQLHNRGKPMLCMQEMGTSPTHVCSQMICNYIAIHSLMGDRQQVLDGVLYIASCTAKSTIAYNQHLHLMSI